MVIGYPDGTDIEKELAASPSLHTSKETITASLPDLEEINSGKEGVDDDWEVVDESLMSVVTEDFCADQDP